jgi:predicted methyltransferase
VRPKSGDETTVTTKRILAPLCALALAAFAAGPGFSATMNEAAVADSARPPEDTARDAERKPAAILDFAHVHAGETVLELIPGGGYFTRILSKAVGPTGTVYAASPPVQNMGAAAEAIAADPRYANVKAVPLDATTLGPAGPMVDLIFTAQNYHDLHLTMAHQDVPMFDKYLFGKLKSGGILIVIDHVAADGAPVTETADTLHRIDPAAVLKEVESAGFVFDGQLDVLRNPNDTHLVKVFDPTIRGHTDQFVFRFRKP